MVKKRMTSPHPLGIHYQLRCHGVVIFYGAWAIKKKKNPIGLGTHLIWEKSISSCIRSFSTLEYVSLCRHQQVDIQDSANQKSWQQMSELFASILIVATKFHL